MSVHDFWSGRVSVPPGLPPALPRHAATGQCIPQRNRITGAYQPPAPVWGETLATPLAAQCDVLRDELHSARQIIAELEHDVEFYRQQVDDLRAQLEQSVEQIQPVIVGGTDRFEWLEIRGGGQ